MSRTQAIHSGQQQLAQARRDHERRPDDPIGHKLRSMLRRIETGPRIEQLINAEIAAILQKQLPAPEAQARIEQLITQCTATLEKEHPQFNGAAIEAEAALQRAPPAGAYLPTDTPGPQLPPSAWRENGQQPH